MIVAALPSGKFKTSPSLKPVMAYVYVPAVKLYVLASVLASLVPVVVTETVCVVGVGVTTGSAGTTTGGVTGTTTGGDTGTTN